MKKALFFAGLAAASLSFVACNKEADFYGRNDRFEIVLNTAETRTAIDGMNTVWVNNDQINVFHALAGTTDYKHDTPYADGKQNPFKVEDTETGVFTGALLGGELVEGQSYDWYLFYPYNSYLQSPVNTADGRTYIGCASNQVQRQNGNSDMAHLAGGVNTGSFPLYGIATNVQAGTRPEVAMKHIASAIAVKVTNVTEGPIAIQNVKFTAPEVIVGNFYISFEKEPVTLTPYTGQVSETATLQVQDGADIPAGGSATFYMGIKPFTAAAGSELTLEITGSNGVVTATKTLTAAAVFTAGKIKTLNVDYDKEYVESNYEWVKTSLDKVTATDEFVFVGTNAGGDWAMSNDKGTSAAPTAVNIEVVDGKLKYEPTDDIIWTLTLGSTSGQYAFSPKGAETYLYTTDANNGVRVGTNDNHFFALDAGYLKNVVTNRYVGIYQSTDWRCYTSINNNIKDQTFAPYVKYQKGTVTPEKTFTAALEGADDGLNLDVPASTVSATIHINADEDVAWTAIPSEGLTLSATEGTGSATVTASFAANTTAVAVNFSVLVSTDNPDVENEEYELCITQQGIAETANSFPYEETFEKNQGDFTINDVELSGLSYVWKYNSSKYMKASAYVGGNKKTESWLVSPKVDMSGAVNPVVSFTHCINQYFGDVTKEATVWIKESDGEWAQLTIPSYPEVKSNGWSDFVDVALDVKSYAGKTVQVAFKYTSSTEHAGTWEVKNFKLAEAASGPVDPTLTVPATLSVEEGKTATISVTTNSDGAKTWSTSDATVATVVDGVVTGVKPGTATITLSIAATENYNATSATIAVTVTEAQTGGHYGKVNVITSGKKYLIVGGGQARAMVPPANTTAGRVSSAEVTITDNKIEADATTNAYAVTLTQSGNDVSIVLPNGNYLVYGGSSTNVKGSAEASDFWNVSGGTYGTFRFLVKSADTRALAFRAGENNTFAAYTTANLNGTEYFDIDLYELGAEPAAAPVLQTIAVSGQKTEFYVNDTFEFGGVVTATYDSGLTKDVTASATFSEPDMTTVGSKTVTVTYTESGKTATTSYSITVAQKSTSQIDLTFVFSEKSETTGTASWASGQDCTYTLNSTDYTFSLGAETYMGTYGDSNYLMVKKNSYLGLPAIAGKKLVGVSVTTSASASTSAKGTIYKESSATTAVSSTVALNQKSAKFSWTLSGTEAGKMYYIVISGANAQFVELVLSYE